LLLVDLKCVIGVVVHDNFGVMLGFGWGLLVLGEGELFYVGLEFGFVLVREGVPVVS
jgi:hypothetical protein